MYVTSDWYSFEGQDCLIVSHFIRFIAHCLSNTFAAVATLRESWRNKFSFVFTKLFRVFIIGTNEILLLYKAQLMYMCAPGLRNAEYININVILKQ